MKPSTTACLLALLCASAPSTRAQQPELKNAQVTLPFNELRPLIETAPRADKKPPLPSALLLARYRVALGTTPPTIEAEFEVENFSSDWQLVPVCGNELPADSVAPADATLVQSNGSLCLVSRGAGRTKVTVRFPARTNASQLLLPTIFPATSGGINIRPAKPSARIIAPTLISLANSAEGAEFGLPQSASCPEIRVLAEEAGAPPRWSLQSEMLAEGAPGAFECSADLRFTLESGLGARSELQFPAGSGAIRVDGDGIEDWTAAASDNAGPLIAVTWKDPLARAHAIHVTYRLPADPTAKQWTLGAPLLPQGNSDAFIAALLPEGFEPRDPETVTSVEKSALPQWMQKGADGRRALVRRGANALVVAAYQPPKADVPDLTVQTLKATQRVVAEGATLAECEFAIENSAPAPFQVRLPEGARLVGCNLDGARTLPVSRENGLIEFFLPKSEGKAQHLLSITYDITTPRMNPLEGTVALALPESSAFIGETRWALQLPAEYQIDDVESEALRETADAGPAIQLVRRFARGAATTAKIHYRQQSLNQP